MVSDSECQELNKANVTAPRYRAYHGSGPPATIDITGGGHPSPIVPSSLYPYLLTGAINHTSVHKCSQAPGRAVYCFEHLTTGDPAGSGQSLFFRLPNVQKPCPLL